MEEHELIDPDGVLVVPDEPCGTGVLVLTGSSGRVDGDRVRLLARHGATALSVRWFGGPGQRPGPWEVPLELFVAQLDRLAAETDRLAIVGTSFGAEAALLTALRDPRVGAVAGFSAPAHCWTGVTEDGHQASHWTWHHHPLPHVPYVEDWHAPDDPPAFRGLYDASLAADPEAAYAAAIHAEEIAADVLLVAGGDDQVWDAVAFARTLEHRRHGRATTVVTHPAAGHRAVLPGESVVTAGQRMARGGTPEADRALGDAAWPELVRLLGLRVSAR